MLFIELDFNKLTFLDLNDFKNYKNLVTINTAGNPLLSVSGYPLQENKFEILSDAHFDNVIKYQMVYSSVYNSQN